MIAIFKSDGTRLAISYNGLTLNNPNDAAGDRYEVNLVTTAEAYGLITEEHANDDGMETYDVRKISRIIRIQGILRATSLARLYDREKALLAAFDPAKVSHENPTTHGLLALDFSVPTADTANYATGLVPSRYYARASKSLVPPDSQHTGWTTPFEIELVCADPRRYLQTTSTLSGAGTATNTLADYRSYPTITITMSGAGSATYTIQNANSVSTKALVLNLSGMVNTDVVTVDMQTRTIRKNGTPTPSLYVSGDFWPIEPVANTITITNGTNATTSTVWRRAFCA